MSHHLSKEQLNGVIQESLIKSSQFFSPLCVKALIALSLVGVGTFAAGLSGLAPQRAWTAFHVNTLFWSGLSFIGVLFTVVIHLTKNTWGRPMKRFSEALAGFLPVSLICFAALYLGADHIFPWATHPYESKAHWLNLPRLFSFDLGALILLYFLGAITLYFSIRQDVGVAKERFHYYTKDFAKLFIAGWKGTEVERKRTDKVLNWTTPALAILYAVVFTLIAFDMIMSLDPMWYSTLFGGYYFATNFYIGLAVIGILSHRAKNQFNLGLVLNDKGFHDIGMLTFAFCLVTGYFFWSQYKIIWFGDLTEEIPFVFIRLHAQPWQTVSFVAAAMVFVLPFALWIPKDNKIKSNVFTLIAPIPVAGLLLERFIQVYPSIFHTELALGVWEVGVSLGFFGVFWLCYYAFVSQFPLLAVGDPVFEARMDTFTRH